MALTTDDLKSIKGILDARFDQVDARLDKVDARLDKVDVWLDKIDEKLYEVDERFNAVDSTMTSMKTDIQKLQDDVTFIRITQLENGALKTLDDIQKNYSDTYQRYRDGADKFEVAFIDIDNLKKTVTKHSKQIKKLQKA